MNCVSHSLLPFSRPVTYVIVNRHVQSAFYLHSDAARSFIRPGSANMLKNPQFEFMCQATQAANMLQLTDSSSTFTCDVQLLKSEGNGNVKPVIQPLTIVVASTQATSTKERQTTAPRPSLWRVGLKKGKLEVEKHLLTRTSKVKFFPWLSAPSRRAR